MFARSARTTVSVLGRAGRRALSSSTAAAAEVPLAKRALVGGLAAASGAAMAYSLAPQPAESKQARYNTLMASPKGATIKCCVVEFNVPGAKNGGTDKGPNGHRIDSIPIANGVIKAGGACDIVKYFDTKHEVRILLDSSAHLRLICLYGTMRMLPHTSAL